MSDTIAKLRELLLNQSRTGRLRGLLDSIYGAASTGAEAYGSASSPMSAEHSGLLGGLLMDMSPLGDAKSAYDGVQSAREGDYLGAGLGALGALPMVPNLGGLGILKRSDLKPGGTEFGQWQLDRVERRTRPEEYVDATGQERTKYIADMENAEQSWGSGQPVANIYWMKDKRTGEIKPFGDDTAHYAMGSDSSSFAKKKFSESLAKQQDKWFSDQSQSLGFDWHNTPIKFHQIREWLLKGQINEERAAELMRKYANK